MRFLALIAAALCLAACNNDVLSTRPETDARVPEAPATESPVAVAPPSPAPSSQPPAPITPPVLEGPIPTDRTDAPVPFTDKKVRSLRNDATMALNEGQTLTVVLNVNTTEGYDWRIMPVPAGVTLYGDYYRPDPVAPGVPNIGGARSFLFRGDAPGRYPIKIEHTNGTDIRATKSFFIEVEAPVPVVTPVVTPAPADPALPATPPVTPTTPPG
jgi:predicted secreted protein